MCSCAVLCVVAELVVDDVAVDTVVELLTDVLVLVAVLCVVAELVVDDVAVDTVVELLTDVLGSWPCSVLWLSLCLTMWR